jgi:hypothetical protein
MGAAACCTLPSGPILQRECECERERERGAGAARWRWLSPSDRTTNAEQQETEGLIAHSIMRGSRVGGR